MSEKISTLNENKIVETLCRLTPSTVAGIKCLKLSNGEEVMVFSAGNKFLHVMENHRIQSIINVGSDVLKVLDYFGEKEEIWVVTKDSTLLAIPVNRTNDHANDEASCQAAGPNHEIFAELLREPQPHSSGNHSETKPLSNVRKVSASCVVHWEQGLQNAAIGPNYITTCSRENNVTRLTVYPWNEGAKQISSNFSHQTLLPRDVCSHYSNVTVMLYMSPNKQSLNVLEEQLFSLLFPNNLPNIPVVLIGLQSGLVGYIYVGTKNSHLQMLYHLEQSVVAVFPVCIKPQTSHRVHTPTGNSLVILGALGKLVIITFDKLNIVTREYHIPEPIVCASISKNLDNLYYSTPKEVYIVPLGLEIEQRSGDGTITTLLLPNIPLIPSSLAPRALKIPQVLALSVERCNEANMMVCLSKDGRVLLVKLPTRGESTLKPSMSALSGGEMIKKHLREICSKASHVKQLQNEIRQLDDVIKQLNNMTQLVCEILRNRELGFQNELTCGEAGISFNVEIDYEAQGTSFNPKVILKCNLTNCTKFSFSSNWSLIVQVTTMQPWFNEDCMVRSTKSHSVTLSTSSVHRLSIHMEDSFSYLNPVQISCFVVFRVTEFLPSFLKDSDPDFEKGHSVLVSKTELNILHFLRKQDLCSFVSHNSRDPVCMLQRTLKDFNKTTALNETFKDAEDTALEYSKFSLNLSKKAVEFIEKQVNDFNLSEKKRESSGQNSNQSQNQAAPLSQEACVLRFLLHGSRRQLHCDNTTYSDCHTVARTPNEEVVKFQAVELGQAGSADRMEGLEICVHTSSKALGCAVHSALVKILMPVLQRPSEQIADVPVGELQKQLIKLKEVQSSLELLQPAVAQNMDSTEEHRTVEAAIDKAISIHCELRKIPTIIP